MYMHVHVHVCVHSHTHIHSVYACACNLVLKLMLYVHLYCTHIIPPHPPSLQLPHHPQNQLWTPANEQLLAQTVECVIGLSLQDFSSVISGLATLLQELIKVCCYMYCVCVCVCVCVCAVCLTGHVWELYSVETLIPMAYLSYCAISWRVLRMGVCETLTSILKPAHGSIAYPISLQLYGTWIHVVLYPVHNKQLDIHVHVPCTCTTCVHVYHIVQPIEYWSYTYTYMYVYIVHTSCILYDAWLSTISSFIAVVV